MSEGAPKKICLTVSSKGKKLPDCVKAIGVGIMSFDSFENCKKYYQAIVAVAALQASVSLSTRS